MGSMYRTKLLISGRVQGVFYRQSMKAQALSIGLFGFVRNLDNGMVEAEVFGDLERTNELRLWCLIGPPSARVDDVTLLEQYVVAEDESGSVGTVFKGFEVR
jgi:acylphosphatase